MRRWIAATVLALFVVAGLTLGGSPLAGASDLPLGAGRGAAAGASGAAGGSGSDTAPTAGASGSVGSPAPGEEAADGGRGHGVGSLPLTGGSADVVALLGLAMMSAGLLALGVLRARRGVAGAG